MSNNDVKIFRECLSTLPERDITIENAVTRILFALGILTGSNP